MEFVLLLACVNCVNIFIEVNYVITCILGGSVLDIYSVVIATFFVVKIAAFC